MQVVIPSGDPDVYLCRRLLLEAVFDGILNKRLKNKFNDDQRIQPAFLCQSNVQLMTETGLQNGDIVPDIS